MRRILTIIIAVIVLVVGIALFAPFLIPDSVYRDRAQQAASAQLGRQVTLGGDVSIRFIPRVEIGAENVSIANADGFGDDPFAEMGEMRIAVQLMPLLSRNVIVDEFVLVEPVIRLEQRNGANNWTLGPVREDAETPPPSEGFVRRPGALPLEASLGDIRIEDGLVLFTDGGETKRIEGLDLAIAMPGVDEPLEIDGSLTAEGEALTFDARLGSLRGVFEGQQTDLRLRLGGRLIDLELDGALREGENFAADGRLDLTVPSLRALASFLGSPLPAGDNLNRLEAGGTLSGSMANIALSGATVRLDDLTATGDLAVALDRARPRVTGNVSIPELDINPYLPAPSQGSGGGGLAPWPDTPIDLSGLRVIDANLRVETGRLVVHEIEVTDAALTAVLDNGRLEATLTRFALYEGNGSAVVVANGRGATPSFSLDADLSSLAAGPFLEAAAGFDRLTGTGRMEIDLLTSGATTRTIMDGLGGSARFNFADGAIRGVNLAQALRTVQASLTSGSLPQGFGDQEETDFSSLEGSVTIANGVATNNDFLMLSPLIRVEGNGTVDIGDQTLDYRLRPRAVASLQGQGGSRDMQGITVPIRIRGSFNNPSIGIDTEAVGRALLQGAVQGAIGGEDPEDALRGALGAALGLGGSNDDDDGTGGEETDEPEDPAETLLRGLFGRRQNSEPEGGDGN
ncbi:AsmA family protein [Hyphobacterium marinum]|uniref:AsmA family protein n=1 Tax=Hyphobacterium marinum TaxID=3116574 RepID=A0ABU7M2W6_9PROT|nr:AsmA family protein [Hyphobacterium sp. Y6023]MEE2567745.1 AsmA family protein [Hyphobacterium sp. Y6023]